MPQSKYNTYDYLVAVYDWLYPPPLPPPPPPPTLVERATDQLTQAWAVTKHYASIYSSLAVPIVASLLLLLLPLFIFLWSNGPPAAVMAATPEESHPEKVTDEVVGGEREEVAAREGVASEGKTAETEWNEEEDGASKETVWKGGEGEGPVESGKEEETAQEAPEVAGEGCCGGGREGGREGRCGCQVSEEKGVEPEGGQGPKEGRKEGRREGGGIKQVPLRVLVGSGTGSGRKLAEVFQKEAFAMNISGYHFAVTVTDMAEYDYVDELEVGGEGGKEEGREGGKAKEKWVVCEYEFMAEHAHSCCTLLARKKTFHRGGKWYTWIDYAKFHDLIERFEKDGTEFDASDYCAETPAWALKGAPEEGFDPVDTRFRRNKAGVVEEVPYRPTDSGCG
ncbi:hypothetical protein NSK_004020 [Nannochloropsis salina CCMP1776]|uniref:Uncharacterized protein n=1 Tax=Nannochloropsis salina CCMP1776 TaxID=1027361 RepID=A0A4D9D531_9STRA|nr:hypothetical protein NSK_004020 [Nannochloropsis salina CCMP1776]|eukprot:TFJ84555.1 hypothetical protein NSK_004020 [Nannochloropsis salina CCMP1776]